MNRPLLVALGLLALASCDGKYSHNDAQLGTAYAAKELCSCLFVMEMPLDYCQAWTKASPAVVKVSVDTDRKTVESTALLEWGSRAHYDSAKFGCVLDE